MTAPDRALPRGAQTGDEVDWTTPGAPPEAPAAARQYLAPDRSPHRFSSLCCSSCWSTWVAVIGSYTHP